MSPTLLDRAARKALDCMKHHQLASAEYTGTKVQGKEGGLENGHAGSPQARLRCGSHQWIQTCY